MISPPSALRITIAASLFFCKTSAASAFVRMSYSNQEAHHSLLMAWSQTVEVNKEDGSLILQRENNDDANNNLRQVIGDYTFDLTSPREWMEFFEATEAQEGAYTVLRCDVHTNNTKPSASCMWGRDFHMKRLVASYGTLDKNVTEKQLECALETTRMVLDGLVNQALLEQSRFNDGCDTSPNGVMLTILWQRGRDVQRQDAPAIVVRGHACFSDQLEGTSLPQPILVTVAPDHDKLPNRYNHSPEAKLSSWCRRRRPLERDYKLLPREQVAGEVILTKRIGDKQDLELLEGLTSNLFIVYSDMRLCTANLGVLRGFARNLVLECAPKLGLVLDFDDDDGTYSPIRLEDVSLWKEVFLTSSVRLVVPVRKVFIPNERGEFQTLWSSSDDEFPTCQLLYREVLRLAEVEC